MNRYRITLINGRELTAHGPNKTAAIRSLTFVRPSQICAVELLERGR